MYPNIISTTTYEALTIVSQMMFGGDKKDQDRARWSEPCQIACVCDGVTSSLYAVEAAGLASSCAPFIFNGNVHDRLAMLCEFLMTLREDCQENKEVIFPENTPVGMQQMLYEIIMRKRSIAYQTTMVAAKFVCDYKGVDANVIKFGDSAVFACSPSGDLLSSSLSFPSKSDNSVDASDGKTFQSYKLNRKNFGPGDDILVRVEGSLSQYHSLAIRAGIRPENTRNWTVCAPVDSCNNSDNEYKQNLLELQVLPLIPQDRLLVPKFLYGTKLTCQGQKYRLLRYSSTIRYIPAVESVSHANSFGDHSPATKVLPDHFYSGDFDLYQDRFPHGTNFILCSDGFYGSFSNWQQLWEWIEQNAVDLNDNNRKESILDKLHMQLNSKKGDDDISFVWVRPKTSKPTKTQCQINHSMEK